MIPIPALWMVAIAAIVGPALALYGVPKVQSRKQGLWILFGATVGYGWVSGQLVIATGLLAPWLLPVATVWIYQLPALWRLPQS